MPQEEKNTVAAILTNLLVVGYFGWQLMQKYQGGEFGGPDGLAHWAQSVLWMVPASIIVTIVVTILVNIVFAIAANDENPSDVVDERDRDISRRGMVSTMVLVSAGFIISLIALATGSAPILVLNMILASFALGDLGGSVVRMFLYRRGY